MTPDEREALKLAAQKAEEMRTGMGDAKNPYFGNWHQRTWDDFNLAASPEAILSLISLISSLELTLSNANSAEALQVGQIMDQTARINKLEKALRDCLEYIDIPRESCFDDSQLGRAYALLAAPPEPTPEERNEN